jgi:hypothetical protein
MISTKNRKKIKTSQFATTAVIFQEQRVALVAQQVQERQLILSTICSVAITTNQIKPRKITKKWGSRRNRTPSHLNVWQPLTAFNNLLDEPRSSMAHRFSMGSLVGVDMVLETFNLEV